MDDLLEACEEVLDNPDVVEVFYSSVNKSTQAFRLKQCSD